MCKWGTYTNVHIPVGGWNGTGEARRDGTHMIPIDSCIADLVKALNDGGLVTRDSCCGHGKGPGKIRLVDGRTLIVDSYPQYRHPMAEVRLKALEQAATAAGNEVTYLERHLDDPHQADGARRVCAAIGKLVSDEVRPAETKEGEPAP